VYSPGKADNQRESGRVADQSGGSSGRDIRKRRRRSAIIVKVLIIECYYREIAAALPELTGYKMYQELNFLLGEVFK